jgi:alpha-1,2-mannosyltransferase
MRRIRLAATSSASGQVPLFGMTALVCCGLLLGVDGLFLVTYWGRAHPLSDFAVFWTAGRLALAGKATLAYDPTVLQRAVQAAYGEPVTLPFVYPPMLLLILAPLGLLPFAAAATLWVAGMLAAFLAAIRAIMRDNASVLVALAAPAVLMNGISGNTAPLAAGLLGGALATLETRPIVSGILIGMLALKPHFGTLLPFFLAAGGRWRAFGAAAATVCGLVALTAALFGTGALTSFAATVPTVADGLLSHHRAYMDEWSNLQSVYGMLRALGTGPSPAWCVHVAVAIAAAGASLRIAVSSSPYPIKAAALALATFILTPYSQLNDAAILLVAWGFLFRDGMRKIERAALWAVYALPLLFILGRLVVRVLLGLPPRISPWGGIGQMMCALLVVIIGLRLKWSDLPELAGVRARPPAAGSDGRRALLR